MHIVYFWSSLVFLIFRMLSVTLHAARVNDEAKRPVEVLRAIPTKYFYPEAQRFLDDVMNANITLTGMRFFSMNRTLILSVRIWCFRIRRYAFGEHVKNVYMNVIHTDGRHDSHL